MKMLVGYRSFGRRATATLLRQPRGSHAAERVQWHRARVARWARGDAWRAELIAASVFCGPEIRRLQRMNDRHAERLAAWRSR